MTEVRISVRNDGSNGGLFTTPVWFGVHDDNFNLFDIGAEVSEGVERIAEDGTFEAINAEFSAAQPNGQGGVLFGQGFGAGTPPVLAPGAVASDFVTLDAATQFNLSLAAMILPSNDAFIGTSDEIVLFDEEGNFLGEQVLVLRGDDIYDAGTEVNTELDAAFINQTEDDAGVEEGGVVTQHPGFNGSVGNPEGEGDQIILGGTNAVGADIDPVAADFTIEPSAFEVATFHVNSVVRTTGSDEDETLRGTRSDDIITGEGGDDILIGGRGWDVFDGGAGDDFLFGNVGSDELSGGDGDDVVRGGTQADILSGGAGNDRVVGGGNDDFIFFSAGDGEDRVIGFGIGDDVLVLEGIEGVSSFEELLETSRDLDNGNGAILEFGEFGQIVLPRVSIEDLSESDFVFL